MNKTTTNDMVETALLIALVFITTSAAFNLPIISQGGLVHFGNVMVVISTLVFGTKKGVYASSFGMALFNILGPHAIWAPFTFVIRGLSSYVMGTIAFSKDSGNNNKLNFIAVLVGSIINMIGYYIAEVILFGNWFTPIYSIPGEIVQAIIALFIGLPLAITVKKLIKSKNNI